MVPHFCKTIERWFFEASALRGIDFPGVRFEWKPPRKEILDLKNELPAIVAEIRAGLNTWPNALRERGVDPEEFAEEIKESNELWDRLGLVLDVDGRVMSRNGQFHSTGVTDGSEPNGGSGSGPDGNDG